MFFKVHLCCSIYQDFIPFYSQIVLHYVGLPFLSIYSVVDGYLGYFHILAIKNNTAMSIVVQVSM